MMTPEQLVSSLQGMEPENLRRTAELAARMFAGKAETIYDLDPDNNGRQAQPYADISNLLQTISEAFDSDEDVVAPDLDDEAVILEARPTTISEALEDKANPWGGR